MKIKRGLDDVGGAHMQGEVARQVKGNPFIKSIVQCVSDKKEKEMLNSHLGEHRVAV